MCVNFALLWFGPLCVGIKTNCGTNNARLLCLCKCYMRVYVCVCIVSALCVCVPRCMSIIVSSVRGECAYRVHANATVDYAAYTQYAREMPKQQSKALRANKATSRLSNFCRAYSAAAAALTEGA